MMKLNVFYVYWPLWFSFLQIACLYLLPIFLLGCPSSPNLSVRVYYMYYLDTNPLSDICIRNIFS